MIDNDDKRPKLTVSTSSSSMESLLRELRENGPAAVRAAGRLMSLLENNPERLPELLAEAEPDSTSRTRPREPRLILGITGAPGSGKSTLTDAMVRAYRKRSPEERIGVIAVDPSSPFTGGALLGDRVRMMRHATDPMVFVRSLASRGHFGGLALGVKGVLRVMGLLGIDIVLIETVGVGQSEIDVVRVADEVAVVLAPGQGDSVQLLKAGLMEIGNFIVINKADREGAEELYHQVLSALKMEADGSPAAARHVSLVSAVEQQHIDELVEAIEAQAQNQSAQREHRRAAAFQHDLREAILEAGRDRLLRILESDAEIQTAFERLSRGGGNLHDLLETLLKRAARVDPS